jgi:hypothetical protein
MTAMQQQSRQARHYHKLVKARRCPRCREHAARGRVHCPKCAKLSNEASKRRYERLLAAIKRLEALVEAQHAA